MPTRKFDFRFFVKLLLCCTIPFYLSLEHHYVTKILILLLAMLVTVSLSFSSRSSNGKLAISENIGCVIAAILLTITFIDINLWKSRSFYTILIVCFLLWSVLLFKDFYLILKKDSKFGYKLINANNKSRKNYILKYALLFFASSLIYFLAYFPGIFVIDSINQWDQLISTFPWNDWHPVGHTAVIAFFSGFGFNPAGFILFQVITYSLIMGYFFDFVSPYFTKIFRALILFFFLLYPLFPLFSVMIVKDSLFSYFVLLYTIIMLKIVISNGNWLNKRFNLLLLFISEMGFLFFRHNGWPVFIAFLFLSAPFLFRKRYLKFYLVNGISIITFLIITGPIYNYYHIFKTDSVESLGILVQVDAGIITNNGHLSTNEKKYFYEIMNKKDWERRYDPRNVDTIKFSSKFNKKVIIRNEEKFIEMTKSIIKKNKFYALKAYLLQIEMVWHAKIDKNNMRPLFRDALRGEQGPYYFLNSENKEKFQVEYPRINIDNYGSGSSKWHQLLRKIQIKIVDSRLYILIMPSVMLIFFLLVYLKLFLDKKIIFMICFFPYGLLLGSLLVALPAQDVRYLLFTYFMPFLILAVNKMTSSQKSLRGES